MSIKSWSETFSSYCTPVQVKIVLIIVNLLITIPYSIMLLTDNNPANQSRYRRDSLLMLLSVVVGFVLLAFMIFLCNRGYIKTAWVIVALPLVIYILLVTFIILLLLFLLFGLIMEGIHGKKQQQHMGRF